VPVSESLPAAAICNEEQVKVLKDEGKNDAEVCVPKLSASTVGGVLAIKGDGQCCYYCASAIGELCKDEDALIQDWAP